jgi:hypothetical protein
MLLLLYETIWFRVKLGLVKALLAKIAPVREFSLPFGAIIAAPDRLMAELQPIFCLS